MSACCSIDAAVVSLGFLLDGCLRSDYHERDNTLMFTVHKRTARQCQLLRE